jgi:hypothetical protein
MHKKKIFCMHTRPDSTKKNLARTGPAVLLSGSKQKKNLRAREVTGQRNGADRRCCLQSGSKKKKQNTARAAGEVTAQGVSACKRKLRAPQGGSDQTLLSPAESDQKAAASKIKKNSTLRAPQGKWLHRGKVARLTRKQTKKVARPAKWMTGKKKFTGALVRQWRSDRTQKNAARQRKIKNLHEEATGQEKVLRDKRKRCSATRKRAGDRPATGQKGVARLKKLQVTDLRGQAGQRPVQPVHYVGSTGFNQDGPGKNWLKTAELKFSC